MAAWQRLSDPALMSKPDDRVASWPQHLKASLLKFLRYIGPGYIIAVGYMDPGNWATDLAAGSRYQYALLCVILFSNFMAIVLQALCVKLGIVSGMDLAQACRATFPRALNIPLYLVTEIAIIATDLAEVIGSAIALNLLFGIPLHWGCVITSLDVFVILMAYRNDQSLKAVRFFECVVMAMVFAVGTCFAIELGFVNAPVGQVVLGFLPSKVLFTDSQALYLALGVLGATVMPHNIYLHSHLVKARAFSRSPCFTTNSEGREVLSLPPRRTDALKIPEVIKHSVADLVIALTFAVFVNSAIMIVGGAAFYQNDDVESADLFDGHRLLTENLGYTAGLVYAIALLLSGQSSTFTCTLAGQVVMEGFLGLTLRPWVRRLITRLVAIVPALVIAVLAGRQGLNHALVASQVALSLQLPFAVLPLVYFTCKKDMMTVKESTADQLAEEAETASIASDSPDEAGESYENGMVLKVVGWTVAALVASLNAYLLIISIVG